MFVELVRNQSATPRVPSSVAEAKRSWRRQRRVQKIMTRAII